MGAAPSQDISDDPWTEAHLVAALFAIDPSGLGGIVTRARAGPVRDEWLSSVRKQLASDAPFKKVPLEIPDGRLIGGLDLTATLSAGRPVVEHGVLAAANGGVIIVPSAERRDALFVARLSSVLDRGAIALERDGLTGVIESRFGVIALDESLEDEERPQAALLERLSFHIELPVAAPSKALAELFEPGDIARARQLHPSVAIDDEQIEALCAVSLALGVGSLRAVNFAVKTALAHAALRGEDRVSDEDTSLAARLVLAPRATQMPVEESDAAPDSPPEDPPPPQDRSDDNAEAPAPDDLQDLVLAAAIAAIPPGLLATLKAAAFARSKSTAQGKAGALHKTVRRGRPSGVRRGDLKDGQRLNIIETLRSAAPWQTLRQRERVGVRRGIDVRRDDFRLQRFKSRSETATVFVVDASGSAALNRLAEAKGAVELLLADCYVRRDSVALISFRGKKAEVLLPPVKSLVRAKRSLAALPGGGGTPLAAAIDETIALADGVKRKGTTISAVFLTDGRANVARDGSGGRLKAEEDAVQSARAMRALGIRTLVIDTSPNPGPQAERIAQEMGALYVALPHADSHQLSRTVRAATQGAGRVQ